MPETIEAKELALMEVFSDSYLFNIPDFQRPYVWETEHVGELLDDLIYAMRGNERVEDLPPYFLGSIVIIKKSDSTLSHIVDGQQRITTLTILLSALRELSSNEKHRNTIHRRIREDSDPFAGIEGRFRLSVRKKDGDFFKNRVQKLGELPSLFENAPSKLSDSQQRMLENASYLWKNLAKLDENRRDRLTSFLIRRCYLVVVSASDQSSAYRIFAVMNDRGLDLSPTDILKADIIGAMDEGIRTEYTDVWETIEEELGRDSFRDLFAHIRMIYMKEKARKALNEEFQINVLNRVNGRRFIDDVLIPYANAYEAVSRADHDSVDGARKVNLHLEHLRWLDNFDWIPPAMAFFNRKRNDTDALLRFVRDLERLAYGMFIRRADINQRINRYARVLHDIERDEDHFEGTASLQLTSDEKTEILKVLKGPVYSIPRVPRPLLLRLDSLLAETGAKYAHKTVSVEHVLPQNPKEKSHWDCSFSEQQRDHWTHRLANLVLLSRRKNSQAQNYDFERKKKEYFQRGGVPTFALTVQVLDESEWTPQILQRRQKYLVNKLKKEWRLD